jgi:hypothetical protein
VDITKCKGGECPLKATCWRFTATASEYRQSWFASPPYLTEDGVTVCEYYVEAFPS